MAVNLPGTRINFFNILSYIIRYYPFNCFNCGVRGREVERRPCYLDIPSSSPGSGSQLWDFSLAHTFGASTGVVPRKQNRERLV